MIQKSTTSSLTTEVLAGLSSGSEPPCLSLYQPTHRCHPDNQQDPIRFRNLVKELEESLRRKYPTAEVRPLLEPFEALAHNAEFWNHTLDGLAVLGGRSIFRVLRIPQPVAQFAVAADRFHTKPLRRFLQSVDRYHVLGLSLDRVRLFEGNRHALDELELVEGVPRTITDALGAALSEPHETDATRFFRAVDRAVLEHYSKPTGLPLVLAASPEHHHLFRQVSQNSLLVQDGIRANPDALSAEELCVLAWQAVEPRYQERLASLREDFEHARSKRGGSDDLVQVAQASLSGRVETLLIDADRQIASRLDCGTGRMEFTSLSEPHIEELLDELSELVANTGGTVLVIPSAGMPSRTGLAAIYR